MLAIIAVELAAIIGMLFALAYQLGAIGDLLNREEKTK